ncbi:MAG: hypothetical protein AAFX56_15355 [Pseudomonadota bacterium]
MASFTRFPAHELSTLKQLTQENTTLFLEAWDEFFSSAT